jgi:tRNA1Val (adenine37-N6)-methyltransferase
MDSLTHDTFFSGKITIRQSRAGYRYSIDTVILAHHVKPKPGDQILDLGTGCGIVPIMLAFQCPGADFYGVEIQPELADIASWNVRENCMENQIKIMCRDMKTLNQNQFQTPMDIVVSNPPYRRVAAGRINPNSQRAVARHEIRATLPGVVAVAGRMLRTAGKFIIIYSAERLTDLLVQLRSARIEPKFIRFIHSKEETGAKLILLQGLKEGKPGLKVGAPLVIYGADGDYSAEVKDMLYHPGHTQHTDFSPL